MVRHLRKGRTKIRELQVSHTHTIKIYEKFSSQSCKATKKKEKKNKIITGNTHTERE